MSSITFFLLFIPILGCLLLAVNLIFAPHNPYKEKNSAFECGFTSFLGQNRTQFSISFFIFALLFLLFDLEILLVYPYLVSAYTNETYGLAVILIFLLALTLGFAFELGKKALSIDSRQTYKATSDNSASINMVSFTKSTPTPTHEFSKRNFSIVYYIKPSLNVQDKHDKKSLYEFLYYTFEFLYNCYKQVKFIFKPASNVEHYESKRVTLLRKIKNAKKK